MGGIRRIYGPISAAVLLSVPAVALAALQPWSNGATPDRSAALAVIDGAGPAAASAAVAPQRVVDLSDWKYTGKSDKSAKSDKSKKSPKSMKSQKSKKSKKSGKPGPSKKSKGKPPHGKAHGHR